MQKNKKTLLSYSQRLILLLALLFAVSGVTMAQTGSDWTSPPLNPPAGNVPAPINVGGSVQTKVGGLILGGLTNMSSRTHFVGRDGSGNHWFSFGPDQVNTIGININNNNSPENIRTRVPLRFTRPIGQNAVSTGSIVGGGVSGIGGRLNIYGNAENNIHFSSNAASRLSLGDGIFQFFLSPPNSDLVANWNEIIRIQSELVQIFTNLRVRGNTNITGNLTVEGDTNLFGEINTCTGSGSSVVCSPITSIGGGSSLWTPGSGSNIYRASGNVGVGTNSPEAPLHVFWSGNIDGLTLERNSSDGSRMLFRRGGTNIPWSIRVTGDSDLFFGAGGSGGTERIRIKHDTGNVGIGNINPQSRLDVNGDVCATVAGVRRCLSTVSGGEGGELSPNDVSKWQTIFQVYSSGQSVPFLIPKDGNVVVSIPTILRLNNSALLEQSGSTRVLTVNSSGNVGFRNLADIGDGSSDRIWSRTGSVANLNMEIDTLGMLNPNITAAVSSGSRFNIG